MGGGRGQRDRRSFILLATLQCCSRDLEKDPKRIKMIGSLISLVKDLTDEELAILIELAISAINCAPSSEIAIHADRLANARYARACRRIE